MWKVSAVYAVAGVACFIIALYLSGEGEILRSLAAIALGFLAIVFAVITLRGWRHDGST